jgi:esterase/lipase superfamily enzyme
MLSAPRCHRAVCEAIEHDAGYFVCLAGRFLGSLIGRLICMPTTVYFATNRVVTNSADAINGYEAVMVPPLRPQEITYGTAVVDGVNVQTGAQGAVSQINDVNQGGFSPQAIRDLSNPGRDLLVFIHGFDNTFSDAVTRAAFNREWFAASHMPGTDTTVIAFCWPSKGKIFSPPVLQADYLADQHMARNSGLALMAFLANLDPILLAAHEKGYRATLLAHSMGNLALEYGVEDWFLHGNGDDLMFDLAALAAGDCRYDAFDQPYPAGLSGLVRLTRRVSIYYSHADQVLQLSMVMNLGAKRLGQDGPHNMADTTAFPPAQYQMVDCTNYKDYDFNFLSSHQYYRLSLQVRSIIAAAMGPQPVA